MDMSKVPFIRAPGADNFIDGYEFGSALDKRFPGREAIDFGSAIYHNDNLIENCDVVDFVCVQQGGNDSEDWIWEITLADGARWRLTAGCDYTGWDCQSWTNWERLPDKLPEIACDPVQVRIGLNSVNWEAQLLAKRHRKIKD